MIRIIILFAIFSLLNSCGSGTSKKFIREVNVLAGDEKRIDPCNDKSNYIPDIDHLDHTPVRYVRINLHYMCDENGKGNFDEREGVEYANIVVGAANTNLKDNQAMALPVGNDTPVYPQLYQYVLTADPSQPGDDGIYFHTDDEYYYILNKGKNRNNYDKGVFEKYGIQKGDVLNVFIQDNHIDSLKSPTYKSNMNGIAFDNWVKCSMWYYNMQEKYEKDGKMIYPRKWMAHKQMNHEIGHVFALRHTWRGNDGCDDTPNHANCWKRTGKPPCVETSNNVMDYNPRRTAWTPCQIGIAHHSMTQNPIKRKLLVPTWCKKDLPPIQIKEDIEWNSCKDLQSDIVIHKGSTLTVRCRVSLPKNAKIEVRPGGKLILDGGRLHNDCGDQWQGIEIWKGNKKRGELILQNEATIENTIHAIEIK